MWERERERRKYSLVSYPDIQQFTFTIPKNTPNGQYLLRGEQIALHLASTFQGAQTYLACAQINVISAVCSMYVI